MVDEMLEFITNLQIAAEHTRDVHKTAIGEKIHEEEKKQNERQNN